MRVYIPTLGRVGRQETAKALKDTGLDVVLVCPLSESQRHINNGHQVLCHLDTLRGISAKRQWIVDNTDDPVICMMDDDLTFAARRADNHTLFRPADPEQIHAAVEEMTYYAEVCGHSAISPREGANRNVEATIRNTRMMRAMAWGRKQLKESGADFSVVELMEDFHVTLHLLTRGYPSISINWLVQNQRGSNTEGGCSTFRTLSMHNSAARALADRYPRFVKTVEKTTKTAWGGATRTDVIVKWKAAYEHGVNTR